MPTTTELQEMSGWLKGQDLSVELLYKPAPTAQWYKADGTPLPKLLPCDAYHITRFREKGWTLTPSARPSVAPVLTPASTTPPAYKAGAHKAGKGPLAGYTPEQRADWNRVNLIKARAAREAKRTNTGG